MIEEHSFLRRLEKAFSASTFSSDDLLHWIKEYGVSPDVLFQRFNVITAHWGLDHVFFHRMVYRPDEDRYRLDKELHLHREGRRYAGRLDEQYCRRWLSSQLIQKVSASGKSDPATGIMKATFHRSGETFLCLGMARASSFRPGEFTGVMIGVRVDKSAKKYIHFSDHPSIPHQEINLTCERCELADCAERAAPPIILEMKKKRQAVKDRIKKITG